MSLRLCVENPTYYANDLITSTSCKKTITSPSTITFSDANCGSDNDCCNPFAKCGLDGFCRFPHECKIARPIPTSSPTQQGLSASITGIYEWTWDGIEGILPPSANVMIIFSGWSIVDNALSESEPIGNGFMGDLYISFGGGNDSGKLTTANLASLNAAINSGRFSRYSGVCYDVELGDSGLSADLEASFIVAKANNLKVFVTVSHSAPYGISDKIVVMENLFNSDNVDYLSPQLYTTGSETSNDYVYDGVSWEAWASSKAPVVVSITDFKLYEDAHTYFAGKGVQVVGFIQWRQDIIPPPTQMPVLQPTIAPISPTISPTEVPINGIRGDQTTTLNSSSKDSDGMIAVSVSLSSIILLLLCVGMYVTKKNTTVESGKFTSIVQKHMPLTWMKNLTLRPNRIKPYSPTSELQLDCRSECIHEGKVVNTPTAIHAHTSKESVPSY
jgi:hypothetical protein